MNASNLIPHYHFSDDESMLDDDDTCQGDDLQIPVPSILKHGNYVSDDEDSDDDALQEAAIQVDLEDYDAVSDENAVNEQQRSETIVNPKVLRAMKNLEASFNPEALKMVAEAKVGMSCYLYHNQAQLL